MTINLFTLPMLIFILSLLGLLMNKSNILLVLMNIEIMLLSLSFNFLVISLDNYSIVGQLISMFIITMAAVESAMGLSMMMSFYKMKGSMSLKFLNLLKG